MNVRVCVGVCGGGKGLSHPVRRVKEGLPRAMQSLQLSLGQPVLCLGGPGHLVEGWSLPHKKKQGSLGLGGGEYRNPGLPLLSLRGPGKAGPSEGGAPLVGHNSLPNHLWLHRHRFSFQGGLYGSSALVWDFPPALGRADPLSASDPSLPLKPSLPLPLLLCPPPTDLEKRHLSP